MCELGCEPLLVENKRRKKGRALGGWLLRQDWLCFCQGLLFSPPIGRGFDGKEAAHAQGLV